MFSFKINSPDDNIFSPNAFRCLIPPGASRMGAMCPAESCLPLSTALQHCCLGFTQGSYYPMKNASQF